MILESNFLIHLERERRRKEQGPASEFLLSNAGSPLVITPTIAGEIACRDSMRDPKSWETFMGYFPSLEITPKVSWHHGGIFRSLKNKSQMTGQNDLWIAATGLAHKHLVVTQNTSEFARVPGLEIRNFKTS